MDLSGEAKPIEDHFGNLAEKAEPYETERLSTGAVHSYVVDANWKIVVENYNECYHCSSIHPELCEVTPTDSGYDHVPTGIWCGGTMTLKDHAVTMSLSKTPRATRAKVAGKPSGRVANRNGHKLYIARPTAMMKT